MAYGVDGPFGLLPTRNLNGAGWNGQSNTYIVDTTTGNLFKGDPVKATANGVIQPAGAGDISIGVFLGCRYIAANPFPNDPQWYSFWLNGTSIRANTVVIAEVVDDPSAVFAVQISAGGNLVQQNMFNTVNWAPAAGNQQLGTSKYVLDFTTIGNAANLNFKMLSFQPSPLNAPNQAFNVAEGIINSHFIRPGNTGI